MSCKYCKELDNEYLVWECPDEPHHGESAWCEECDAEYYREWGGKTWACNDKAVINHLELQKL